MDFTIEMESAKSGLRKKVQASVTMKKVKSVCVTARKEIVLNSGVENFDRMR